MTLSDKIFEMNGGKVLDPEEVKDFIQKLKEDIWGMYSDGNADDVLSDVTKKINKQAGDALVHSPKRGSSGEIPQEGSTPSEDTPEVVPTNSVGSSGTHGCGKSLGVEPLDKCDLISCGDKGSNEELILCDGCDNVKLKFNCTCLVGECVCKNRPKGSDNASCTNCGLRKFEHNLATLCKKFIGCDKTECTNLSIVPNRDKERDYIDKKARQEEAFGDQNYTKSK